MARRGVPRLDVYVYSVITLALIVAELVVMPLMSELVLPSTVALLLAGALVVGESHPILISRGDDEVDYVTIASTFILALAMVGPAWLLLAAEVVAVTWDDVRRSKPLKRLMFNNAQLLLSAAVTREVFCVLTGRSFGGGSEALVLTDLAPALVAGVAFFVVNNGLTGIVVALATNEPIIAHLREDVRFQLSMSGILLAFAPVVVVTTQFSPLMTPLLVLPIIAVHRTARLATDRHHQALHDPLTGLGNRELLMQRASSVLVDGRRTSTATGVLLLDLDHFKEINDTLGHFVGDLMLREVGTRLSAVLQGKESVVRLGGDEFAILVPGLEIPDARSGATAVAERVLAGLSEPLTLEGVRLSIQASIGISLAPDHGSDIGTLMQGADVALYAAKEGRGGAHVYDPDTDAHSVEKLSLLADLREGVDRGEIVVHYLPKCDATTGEVVGVEALARWQHPRRGLLEPADFLAVAENTGLVDVLTMRVLDQALADRKRFGGIGVSVNLSVRALADLELPVKIGARMAEWGVPPGALTLEVREAMIMGDPTRAIAVLRQLGDLGVRLSIDDFGTGCSSLGYLSRLGVHELKIGRSFVTNMLRSSDGVIVQSTIRLGHNLGLGIVAEGVEDEETLQALAAEGCDVVQGYWFTPPLPVDQMVAWLSDRITVPVPRHPSPAAIPA